MKLPTEFTIGLIIMSSLQVASAALITFEQDPPGPKPNGFQSVESSMVMFSDSMGADLGVEDFTPATIGRGLIVNGDDASALIMNFSVPMSTLSIAFGNDDPAFSSPGDLAVLTAFIGSTQVGQSIVLMNRNDINDQVVSFSGSFFDRALFQYTTADPMVPRNLIEDVDNVIFAVPEPSTVFLFSVAGVLLCNFAWFRRGRERRPEAID